MSYSFWNIVEEAKEKSGDEWDSRPRHLKSILKAYSPADIIQFDKDYRQKLKESYTWDLWGGAYLINGGCSDDAFDYFRDFLISEGEDIFSKAVSSPDSLASLEDIQDAELEEYRYAIAEAYEDLTGEEIPYEVTGSIGDPLGTEWDEDDLDSMFPDLSAKYG